MNIRRIFTIAKALALFKITAKVRPLFVSWQLTNRCNLRCRYCDYWQGKAEEELNTDEIYKIIQELAAAGTFAVSFTGGEPLLRDDIGAIISFAKAKGLAAKINTNGLLVPQKIGEINKIDQVNLSFDGSEPIHDLLRGEGTYQATFKAVKTLQKIGKKIVFNTTLSKYNLTELNFILERCQEFKIGVFFQPVTEEYLLNRDINPFTPEISAYRQALSFLIAKRKEKRNYIYNSLSGLRYLYYWPKATAINCHAGKLTLCINAQGKFFSCERLGNVTKIDTLKKAMEFSAQDIQRNPCNRCWCGPLLELNLAFSAKFDAIVNALNIGSFAK